MSRTITPAGKIQNPQRALKDQVAALFRMLPIFCFGSCTVVAQVQQPPMWAFPVNRPSQITEIPDAHALRHVPNSSAVYTYAQVNNLYIAPDWHVNEHPLAPIVVARGRAPDVYACGYCHRITGTGGPENAKIAGLPYDYILQQLLDFQTGTRSTSLPTRVPQAFMIHPPKL